MVLVDADGISPITESIIGCAIRVHSALGPGLLEAPYRLALAVELNRAGLRYDMEKPLPVLYGTKPLGTGYRMDLVVEAKVVIEIKCVERLLPIHKMQLLTYLRLGMYPAGLLFNFKSKYLKDGMGRVLNDRPSAPPG